MKANRRPGVLFWTLCVGLLGGCAGSQTDSSLPPVEEDDPAAQASHMAPALDGYRATFLLFWQGERVGEAREFFAADSTAQGGYRFTRSEHVLVRRAQSISESRTSIDVELDITLSPTKMW